MNMFSTVVTQAFLPSAGRLTPVRQRVILLDNKEKHDSATSKRFHLQAGMDPTREAKKKRQALFVCCSKIRQGNQVVLLWSSVKSGYVDRGQHFSKIGEESKINLRPALGRPQKIINVCQIFIATRLLLKDCHPRKSNPHVLSKFSIILQSKKCQELYKTWLCIGKCRAT